MSNNLNWKAMITREDGPMTLQTGSDTNLIITNTNLGEGTPLQGGWPLRKFLRRFRPFFRVFAHLRRR